MLAVAETRKQAGQNDIAEFVYNRSEKHLNELISKTWHMAEAELQLESEKCQESN